MKHVTMKYRYAVRYTEFVKQCKERILSALLVWRSSKRASGDSHSSGGLESAASCPLVYSLHSSAHYQPAVFTTFFGDTFPKRGLQLTAASDLINTVGRTHKISCRIHIWNPSSISDSTHCLNGGRGSSLPSREIPVHQFIVDIHQTPSWSCSHSVNDPYEHKGGFCLACERW